MDGPQRAMMRLRARRDGRPRSTVDLELPLMALLAVLVGIAVVIWLNGQGNPDGGEIRRVTERPVLSNPREALAAGQAKRAAIAREQARLRRVRAARVEARRRAALAAVANRRSQYARGDYRQPNGQGYSGYDPNGTQGYSNDTQTFQQTQPQQQVSKPAPKADPTPQPKRSGGVFDDSG
jgi:hypothetical protein